MAVSLRCKSCPIRNRERNLTVNRIVRAAGITAAGCVLVVGGAGAAGAAGAYGNGGGKGHQTQSHHKKQRGHKKDKGHHSGASAKGVAIGSPGILSGNVVQVPINIPINICGNSIHVVGILNPAFGNVCINK
ncbi:hypothetical protein ACZ90_29595 [Streptomyces albus subsp. albus]|nr:hypothetical protein ACZ90_29595 [Streptomyces albus subsp. albus]